MIGYCSTIRYRPPDSPLSPVNIGVVLLVPETGVLLVRTVGTNRSIRKQFGQFGPDDEQLSVERMFVQNRLRTDRDSYSSVESLQQFIDTRCNNVRLTPLVKIEVTDAERAIATLFLWVTGGET